MSRYPINPDYGHGAFRRRVRLKGSPGRVLAMVDDNHHAMWVRLSHGGGVVTAITGGMTRAPMDTCPGAIAILQELVGTPVTTPLSDLLADGRPRRNCTHLYDIALLALRFAGEGGEQRIFDMVMPDTLDGRQQLTLSVDGEMIHDWVAVDGILVSPAQVAGQAIMKGFVRWAFARFDGVALDGALMIQKGVIVGKGRPYLVDRIVGRSVSDAVDMLGACYSYTEPRFSSGREHRHEIDFSDGVIEAPEPADPV